MAEITSETGISWKYCPTEKNLADLGSRGAGIHKMETGGWFTGPEWLFDEKQWPDQPDFECTKDVNNEPKPIKEENLYAKKHKLDEWEALLERHKGTNVPEQFFGETTESNKADGAVDTLGDGKRKDTLDQEGPKQYLSKCTNTRLGAGQGGHQHPEV